MKIYYINDESSPIQIRLISKNGDNILITLQPQEGKVFDIEAPESAVPYVKRWDNRIVLLSYISSSALESL